jgi:predicted nuclease of restriction endonuclease-like (RecB) superfamily
VALFDRVAEIIDQARSNVVRAVNSNMVLAYWLIGREIVQSIQAGSSKATYGSAALETLARNLTGRYGPGFSKTNLKYFRSFYLAYGDRLPEIGRPLGDPFAPSSKGHPVGDLLPESEVSPIQHPLGAALALSGKSYPPGSQSAPAFSPQLSWSHYRALMRVEQREAREFYEEETIAGGWDKRTLERQIHSFYYERMLKSQHPAALLQEGRRTLSGTEAAIETLKNPYVLEFLGLPEVAGLQESELESAILTSLQDFLMELGKGFAFVGRQKRLRYEETDRYVDLVFYHIPSRFYLLIDLKLGELTHADVGQMDGYVRMFDDLCLCEGDNPTIGLILCTEKNETVAKYSVLKDRRQIFASKYTLFLPTEEELRREIERERRLIEDRMPTKLPDSPDHR